MSFRRAAFLVLPLLLAGCDPLQNMVGAANQLAMTPQPGTFTSLDCDADGKLSQGEVMARVFLRTKPLPQLHQATAEEFRSGDLDGNGGWSYEEFRAAMLGATAWSITPTGCK